MAFVGSFSQQQPAFWMLVGSLAFPSRSHGLLLLAVLYSLLRAIVAARISRAPSSACLGGMAHGAPGAFPIGRAVRTERFATSPFLCALYTPNARYVSRRCALLCVPCLAAALTARRPSTLRYLLAYSAAFSSRISIFSSLYITYSSLSLL